MKIAYLSTFFPYRGGIAQFNGSLYQELQKNHEIMAFNFKLQYPNLLFPGKTQYCTDDDIVQKIPSKMCLNTINPISYLNTARQITKFAPDILIMKYWMSFFAPSLGTVAKKLKKSTKIITILDNVIPHEKRLLDKQLTKYFLKQNTGFVAMSDVVQNDLLQFIPNAKYIKLQHPTYNNFGAKINIEEARKILNIEQNKKVLLFFGFIRDYKGLDLLLETLTLLDDSYLLLVAGECYGSFNKYQKIIDDNNLQNRVKLFVDYIAENEVAQYFSAADVCILPYKSATQSGISAIANNFALPIIANDVGGLKETIKQNITGLVANNTTKEAIAGEITKYFDNNLKEKFVNNIKAQEQLLSWEYFAGELIKFAGKI